MNLFSDLTTWVQSLGTGQSCMGVDMRYRGQERAKSPALMTKKGEGAVEVNMCWGRVLLCRRKRWNLLVSRAKEVEIPKKP